MKYISVRWSHNNPNYPVLLYSELDHERRETRKVEVFADGSMGYAGPETQAGDTGLGLVPVPPLKEIAEEPEFDPSEIEAQDFEAEWAEATSKRGRPG